MGIPIPDYLERKAAGIAQIVEFPPDVKKALAQSAVYVDEWANEERRIDQGAVSVADMNNYIAAAQADKQRILAENTDRIDAVNKRIQDLADMKVDVIAITTETPPAPLTATAARKRKKTNAKQPKFKPKTTAKR